MVVTYQSNPDLFKASNAESATLVDITGYAWTNTPQSAGTPETGTDQGLGWISMNGTNYGVQIDLEGNFSGYAWIGNGDDGAGSTGWVDFAPTIGFPGAPSHGVRREGNTLTGWAKVVSMYNENTANGWIKMSGTAGDGGSYGVTINPSTGKFSGYAWGSDVIGWVNFAPTISGVTCPSCVSCTNWSEWVETDCATVPVGTPIEQTRYRTCGSTPETETLPTGKTCGSSCAGDPSVCGGGQTCVESTSTCTSNPGGVSCPNGTCDDGESLLTCPQDCKGTVQQF